MSTLTLTFFEPALFACTLLIATTLIFRMVGSASLYSLYSRWAGFLRQRGLFTAPLEAEATKVDLLRIVCGLIFLHRSSYIAFYVFAGNDGIIQQVTAIGTLLVGLCFTLGLLTPIMSLTLLFANIMIIDRIFGTYTLGSDVFTMLLLTFTFAPSGTRLSIDRLIARRSLFFSGLIQATYRLFGTPSVERLVLVKWATLLSYTVLCLYSVMLHLNEPLWTSGYVAVILLTNSYLSKHYEFFQSLALSSELFILLMRMSMWGMLAWYFVFLPFTLLGGWFRKAVILWSILFFLVSAFVLQLGWLPYYEFVLLALLFWDRKFIFWTDETRLDVLYDDRCNLCDRTIRILSRVDVFHALRFRPLTENYALVERLGLSKDDVLRDLHGYDPARQRILSGYDFYAEVARRLLLLLWLAPICFIGRIGGIGPRIYRMIADHRIRWFGVCELSRDYNAVREAGSPIAAAPAASRPTPRALITAFVTIHTVLAALFVAHFPIFKLPPQSVSVQSVAHIYGLMAINVFNKLDLTLGEHWYTIEALRPDGTAEVLPFTGPAGQRLSWHNSDRVYFGNSLHWRRLQLGLKEVCYKEADAFLLKDIIGWHRFGLAVPPAGYRITYYYQPLPQISLAGTPRFRPIEASKVCTALLASDGKLESVTEYRPTTVAK